MNSRQRVKRALAFNNPDRVPISHAVLPAAQLRFGQALDDILTTFREDFGWDYMQDMALEDFPAVYKKGRNTDDFGTVWFSKWLGVCGIPVEWPLGELSRFEEFKWPEDFTAGPPRGRLYSGHMMGYDDRWYARGAWITYFEQLQQLRGMENFLMDIAGESKEFYRLLDDLLDFNLRWIDTWTKLEYDGLHFADDWGGQSGLLIKPETWRRIFKPRYAQMFRRVRERGMDVWYHTDGQVREIFGDLIEIGVQAINCQVAVVGHDWIAKNVRGRVAIRTDIDRQRVLPLGSTTEVREEVHRTFEACGSSQGGIIACGEVGPDVPLENIRAMYEAFLEYGTYPSERIVVVEGDITTQQVDAIVNAANSTLLGGGGVDGAIHRVAGPRLVEECRTLGGCLTGQARITKGYNLPAKWVIHTVGPVWHGFGRREDELLASCYRTALGLAVAKGVRTIAFPAISTGVYGFPLERATAIAVKEVKGFLEKNPSLERVVFVCFGKHAYECYLNAVKHD